MSAEPTADRLGRHDLDMVSLVFGALFTAAGLFYGLVDQGRNIPNGVSDLYLPGLLIVVGVLGLLGSVGRRRGRKPAEPVSDDPAGY